MYSRSVKFRAVAYLFFLGLLSNLAHFVLFTGTIYVFVDAIGGSMVHNTFQITLSFKCLTEIRADMARESVETFLKPISQGLKEM